jgi:hypothetical protein
MPCRDYYDDHPEQYFRDVTEPALKKQVSFAESALCAALAAFEKMLLNVQRDHDDAVYTNPLDYIDFGGAGISKKELDKWWKEHKKLDAQHREQERINRLKETALAKLTDEERNALGLK